MTTTNHTPTPWIVEESDHTGWKLITAGGRIIANVNAESCPDTASAPCSVKMPTEANADFIVEACNNYERVLDERDEAVELLTSVINAFKPHYQYLPAIKKAKTYLAKLEGK